MFPALLVRLAAVPAWIKAGLVVCVIVLGLYAWGSHQAHRAVRAEAHAETSRQVAVTEHGQAQVEGSATQAVTHVIDRQTVIYRQVGDANAAIQSAPGSADAIPPGVLASWGSGIDGLRVEARRNARSPHGPSASDAPGTVPQAE